MPPQLLELGTLCDRCGAASPSTCEEGRTDSVAWREFCEHPMVWAKLERLQIPLPRMIHICLRTILTYRIEYDMEQAGYDRQEQDFKVCCDDEVHKHDG